MIPTMTYGYPIPASSVTVTYTGTAGTTATLADVAGKIPVTACRVVSTTDCFIELTNKSTAAVANTGLYLPAFVPEYFLVVPGTKVSAVQVSAGGSIYVTPFGLPA